MPLSKSFVREVENNAWSDITIIRPRNRRRPRRRKFRSCRGLCFGPACLDLDSGAFVRSHQRPHLILGTYANEDREAAAKIIKQCAGKPIKRLTSKDYCPFRFAATGKALTRKSTATQQRLKDKTDARRRNLADHCVALLRENGAMTTGELAAIAGASHRATACACAEIRGVSRETIRGDARGAEILWMMPVQHYQQGQ